MTALLREFLHKLEDMNVAQVAEPEFAAKKHERPVGTAGDDLRRLFGLLELARLELVRTEKAVQHAFIEAAHGEEDDPEKILSLDLRRELGRATARHEALKELFWASVRDEFPELQDKAIIGIRKGWQAVWTDKEAEAREKLGELHGVIERLSKEIEARRPT